MQFRCLRKAIEEGHLVDRQLHNASSQSEKRADGMSIYGSSKLSSQSPEQQKPSSHNTALIAFKGKVHPHKHISYSYIVFVMHFSDSTVTLWLHAVFSLIL